MTSYNTLLAYQRWYNLRREARKTLANKSKSEAQHTHAKAIIDTTDGIADLNPEFKEYVVKHTEADNIEDLLEKASDEAYYLGYRDDYDELDIMEEVRKGTVTYDQLVERIRETGKKLIEIADAAKY